jgi:hypothetical protein
MSSILMRDNKIATMFEPSIQRAATRAVLSSITLGVSSATSVEYQIAVLLEEKSPFVVLGAKEIIEVHGIGHVQTIH